jgi:hypothetical protein
MAKGLAQAGAPMAAKVHMLMGFSARTASGSAFSHLNKPACIEPNVEILEFMMKEHDPRGIPDEIQNISDMVEMALMADSLQDLVEKTPELGETQNESMTSMQFRQDQTPP